MSWSRVQSRSSQAAASSASLAFNANNAAGNLLIAIAHIYNGGTTQPAVTDTVGNTWSRAGDLAVNGAMHLCLFYCSSCLAGANTVSFAWGGTGSDVDVAILEYSTGAGVASLDGMVSATGTSSTPSAGTIPVNSAGELAIAAIANASGGATGTMTAGTGWTIAEQQTSAADAPLAVEDRFPVSIAVTGDFTPGGSLTWAALGASFRPGASGGGGGSGGVSLARVLGGL